MPDPQYVIYHHDISPFGQRVVIQLEAKGLSYKGIYPGTARCTEAFDAISVLRKLPVLEFGDVHIPESEVICEYLEDVHPEPSLRPTDPLLRARMRLLARIADLYVITPLLSMSSQLNPAERDPNVIARGMGALDQGLAWLEAHVTPGPYAVGDRLSLADCALSPILFFVNFYLPRLDVAEPFGKVPKVDAYFKAIGSDPHVGKALKAIADAFREKGFG